MHIECVELQNYRKLKSCRIEFTDQTTLFVGANNSGKTSAMEALIKFLDEKNKFTINDFTLSNWIEINQIGEKWLRGSEEESNLLVESLLNLIPMLDVWLRVEDHEIHYVTHLIPTLDWSGGLLGVRLRLEPKNIENLCKEFIEAKKSIEETLSNVKSYESERRISLWPRDIRDYLNRRFQSHFTIKAYILDPEKLLEPVNGLAKPQVLPLNTQAIDGDPFNKLFLIHKISAQRGFSDPSNTSNEDTESVNGIIGNLSSQLRAYYNSHLNPTVSPELTDIEALQAIESAQKTFDDKLHEGFKGALQELENLGYPGIFDPKITISTKIKPIDGLNHSSAVQFDLMANNNQNNDLPLRLPEQYNGLGYQNLISIIFKMMQFRDEWMRVGKLSKGSGRDDYFTPPLHLVLIEEPEAHLHIQVQQVFIRQAYNVLCNHNDLKNQNNFKTQLIVSTHSGHIAHEMPFSSLRYFRRKFATSNDKVPSSTVVNLSNVFGKEKETERFVTRYLQLTHCDLLFADAAVLVEGPAERMLVPHFIRNHFQGLNQKYISVLEIGGSHAHTLRPLIEHLNLTSLIITDLDSADPTSSYTAKAPLRNKGYVTGNDTLKTWVPCKKQIDDLFDLNFEDKEKQYENFSVRVAYQYPLNILMVPDGPDVEAVPYTFEDALVFENLTLFKSLKRNGLIRKFRDAINNKKTIVELAQQFFTDLRTGKKAEFALEIIYLEDLKELKVPTYIKEGLSWLENQLKVNYWDNNLKQNVIDSAEEEEVQV